MFSNLPPVILASGSPRRKSLLNQIRFPFTVVVSDVDEDFSLDLPPAEFACYFAAEKARTVASSYPGHLVIGADTIVVLKDEILGKPKNAADSRDMLTMLSGKTHTVMTAVALLAPQYKIEDVFMENTRVTFANLSPTEIDYYIRHYTPFDKAGSYGIQDWFSVCVTRIEGCFYNVVGFPLSTFYQHIKSLKFS